MNATAKTAPSIFTRWADSGALLLSFDLSEHAETWEYGGRPFHVPGACDCCDGKFASTLIDGQHMRNVDAFTVWSASKVMLSFEHPEDDDGPGDVEHASLWVCDDCFAEWKAERSDTIPAPAPAFSESERLVAELKSQLGQAGGQ